jgi:hypothetical protein
VSVAHAERLSPPVSRHPALRLRTSDAGRRAAVVAGVLALLVTIHLSYQFLVAPRYSYMKLTYQAPDLPIYVTMVLLLVALAGIMPIRLRRPADFLLWVLYVLVVIPSLTISYLARTVTDEQQLMLGFVVSGSFAVAVLASRLPSGWLASHVRPLTPQLFWILVAVFSAVTYLSLATSGSLRLSLPGLGEVYSVRSTFAEAASANRLLAYLMPSQASVINPLLIAAGIGRRRVCLVLAGVVGELLLYGAAGNKSILFSIPALLLVAFFYRGGRRPPGTLISWGLAGIIGAAALIDEVLSTPWLTSLFTRRFIDVPGLLTGAWVNTFSQGPKAHFAYSFLSSFLSYPYPVTPPFVVAEQFFNTPSMNANANLFADGYANFGWPGMVFEALVFAAILVLANAAGHRMPTRAAVMLLVMPAISLSNGSVLTSLLTHGVLLALLTMAFAPPSVWERSDPGVAGVRGVLPERPVTSGPVDPVPGAIPSRDRAEPTWWQRWKGRPMTAPAGPPDHSSRGHA